MHKGGFANGLSSLTAKLLVVIVLYATVLAASFSVIGSIVNMRLDHAFPSIDSVLKHQDALEQDAFSALSTGSLSRCGIVIFDSLGQRLYASSKEAASDLSLSFMQSFEDFDTVEEEDFAGLSNCVVEKHDYETLEGKHRTLLLASPILNEDAYERIVEESNRLWFIIVPIIAIATLGAGLLTVRIVKRALRPLDDAISFYKGSEPQRTKSGERICTELVPIHDNFTELMQLLQNERDGKRQMMADISHDLRTPLTVIRGYAQALRDDRVPESKRLKYLSIIADRSDEATLLLEELFVYSKMDHPSYQMNSETIDLAQEIRDISAAYAVEAERRNCRVEVDVSTEPIDMIADRLLLCRAISNLLGNAIKHGGEGARVKISCTRDDGITMCVSNTGNEIAEDIRATIFEPFVTGDDSRMNGTGTGLGLAIARKCIELNRGSIRLEEKPIAPFTTSFVCTFPATEQG